MIETVLYGLSYLISLLIFVPGIIVFILVIMVLIKLNKYLAIKIKAANNRDIIS